MGIYFAGHKFKSIIPIIYFLDSIESGLAFSFLWNKYESRLNYKGKMWILRVHQVRTTGPTEKDNLSLNFATMSEEKKPHCS